MACRFFLGISEAGFGPGIPYLLSFFYLRHEVGYVHFGADPLYLPLTLSLKICFASKSIPLSPGLDLQLYFLPEMSNADSKSCVDYVSPSFFLPLL